MSPYPYQPGSPQFDGAEAYEEYCNELERLRHVPSACDECPTPQKCTATGAWCCEAGPKGYCATCNNTGSIDCHCGGDMCVCGEEEIKCPE